ncbi:cytochrome C biogenesis protein [Helicobacter sp. MIT 00-7814]|uniref:cytochrome c biogenesis CcdA family protein n=1 Tax=unclassified Helicobacter TaxID=2593540 RepID=UPI000E1FB15D|nr:MULTISPECIES: cytochrome c biogenesis protein CcdA [unclassified Helicobacter]RDU55010.1 cytochrome C biogenesis protein [Helicobacter sp. MIT 00-7814]RDU55959.1 cytochrome C biogenesis protein [Helicobacter sp. MIT 99-10781]
MEELLYDTLFQNAPLVACFLAGILTFLSPCILPLIPAYISYISGVSLQDIKENPARHRIRVFLKSLLFVAGFCGVFVLFALFFGSFLGQWLKSDAFRYIAGFVVIIFGVHFVGIFRIGFLNRFNVRLNLSKIEQNKFVAVFAPFFLGISFGACWSPCAGPILGSVLALGASRADSALSLALSFSAGLGMSFLLTALLVERALEFLGKIKSFMRVIEILCGVLLILIGLLILGDKLNALVGI